MHEDFTEMSRNESQRKGIRRARNLRVHLVALLAVAMLAFPALAAAQSSPTDDQYDPCTNCSLSSGGSGGSGGLGGNVGPLPFTGFDVIAMVAVALAVTGVGLALQRAVARESADKA